MKCTHYTTLYTYGVYSHQWTWARDRQELVWSKNLTHTESLIILIHQSEFPSFRQHIFANIIGYVCPYNYVKYSLNYLMCSVGFNIESLTRCESLNIVRQHTPVSLNTQYSHYYYLSNVFKKGSWSPFVPSKFTTFQNTDTVNI